MKSSFVYNYCVDDGSVTPNTALQVTHLTPVSVFVCACVRACVRACVYACVRACMLASVCVCV